jgi:predicted phage terminase large subunit-like protein
MSDPATLITTWVADLLRDLDPSYVWEEVAARTHLCPQPGPQTDFLASEADITIYGGAAGGGKSFGLLLAPLQWSHVPGFGAVIFRRTTVQVRAEGGLWDDSAEIYPALGATPREQQLEWRFPAGATVSFAHMEYERNRLDWQGSQICLIGFDELTHFTWRQFSYMFSRNRSTCGVRPRIMATTNPDADSWVTEFIGWWIDQETGFPIPERAGVLRWFVQFGDDLIWGDSRETLLERYPDSLPMSVTFIPAKLEDNPALTSKDPAYRGKLMALDRVERERLLNGNWKIRPVAGMYFRREWFEIVDQAPADMLTVRFWDFAGSKSTPRNKDPDWTVGLLLGYKPPTFYVLDVVRMQDSPGAVEQALIHTAELDGRGVPVFVEQEPGSSSLYLINSLVDKLPGHVVTGIPSTGSKQTRAKPVSSAAEHGKVVLVRGEWNRGFLAEVEYFPDGAHDDQVDALSGAHAALVELWKLLAAGDEEGVVTYDSPVSISPV